MIDPIELGFEVFGYSGDEALVRCPYHSDEHPSARFNCRTGLFFCFVCGVGRSAKQIEREFGGHFSSIKSIVKRDFEDPSIDWHTRFLSCKLALDNAYLQERGVTRLAVIKLGIRECKNGDIVFPLFSDRDGTIGGVQVRQLHADPKYVFYGTKPGIYPLVDMPPRGDAYLVEGIFSVIRGCEAGFEVFATMGAASLIPALRYFYDRTKVFGIFDPDAAGHLASAKLASIGIACLKDDFEPDEMSVPDWMNVVIDKRNFTMDALYFANKAVASGSKMKTIMNQILKFEEVNR